MHTSKQTKLTFWLTINALTPSQVRCCTAANHGMSAEAIYNFLRTANRTGHIRTKQNSRRNNSNTVFTDTDGDTLSLCFKRVGGKGEKAELKYSMKWKETIGFPTAGQACKIAF